MQKYKTFNNQKAFVLNAVDLYSKFAWSIPIAKKDEEHMLAAFKTLIDGMKEKPKMVQTDNGGEFGDFLEKYLTEQGIKLIHSKSYTPTSQGAIERFNGTLKRMIGKYMEVYKTKKYVDVLQELVDNYNNSIHSTTNTQPAKITGKTKIVDELILKKAEKTKNYSDPADLKKGDYVRIKTKQKSNVGKKTYPLWSKTIYRITKVVKPKNPLNDTYYIVNGHHQYANELLKVPKKTDSDILLPIHYLKY